ncbi:MAG: hypothetical protein P9M07_07695 [Candidatus Aceula meridiana]|nr:hypothetical protein [Candidatus Aceula meridiana]
MKKLITILTLLLLSTFAFAQENSLYEYSELPDVCFFPILEARWDGNGVTVQDFKKFTEDQRAMFVAEGMSEIEWNTNSSIEYSGLKILLMKVEKSVVAFVSKNPDTKMLMIQFFQKFLKSRGMLIENDEMNLEEICEGIYCRKVDFKLKQEDGSVQDVSFSKVPVAQEGAVVIFPGETIYLEADEGENSLENLRAVESLVNPDKTLVFKFSQEEDSAKMTLNVEKNPFSKAIKYHAEIVFPNGALQQTSTCPVRPGIGVYELWPHPIFQMLLRDFRLFPEGDPAVEKCEY